MDLTSHGEGKDLNYTLEFDELPLIKLQTLDNVKFTEYKINISEDEIKKKIDEISNNQKNFKDKKENESAANGDLVVFNYEATIENKSFEGGKGEKTQIILGQDLFIKGFDKQLLGVKKNQKKEVQVTLPENYPKKEFVNKNAKFICKILNVKKPETVEINDQFAKNLGAKDLNDLKILVRKQIENQYKVSLDALSKDSILKQIEKLHNVDLPDSLVQQELELISQGLKKEDVNKNKTASEEIAKKRIKLGIILNEFGEKNNLKVDEQELKNEIQKQIQSMPGQQKQVLEYYEKNPSAAASLRGSIYEDKIINLIKTKLKKTIKSLSTTEAEKLISNQSKQEVSNKSEVKKASTKSNIKKKESKKVKKPSKLVKTSKKIRKK